MLFITAIINKYNIIKSFFNQSIHNTNQLIVRIK